MEQIQGIGFIQESLKLIGHHLFYNFSAIASTCLQAVQGKEGGWSLDDSFYLHLPLEMGTNHQIGSLCQFVVLAEQVSVLPSSTSSDGCPLRGSIKDGGAGKLGHCL